MEMAMRYLLPLVFVIPLVLSGIIYRKAFIYRKHELHDLSEFFISLTVFAMSSWFLMPMGGAFVLVSMLSWIWILRSLGKVTQNISGFMLFSKFHLYGLALGGVISIIFLGFDFNLATISAPFALSVGLIGLTFIFQAYSRGKSREYSFLHHLNLFVILSFFISRLIFPMLISYESRTVLINVIDTYFVLILSTSLYPLYAEIIFEGQEKMLERVLRSRNKQLLSHSGFSEYKILSAGLSHEINNALTIINAKLVRLLRGNPEFQKDFQTMQKASNRIVSGIRGLREFIYPLEVPEVLDVHDVVQSVLALYGQRLMNHGVQVNLHDLTGKLIKGQRVQIAQIFLSLINNSVNALDQLDEKWINISSKVTGANVEILYEDSSRSQADEIRPILNDPYYSLHEFMDNDIRLILIKEIAEKNGGKFSVKQQTNSAFMITLPEEDAPQSSDMYVRNRIQEARELH